MRRGGALNVELSSFLLIVAALVGAAMLSTLLFPLVGTHLARTARAL